MLPNGGPENTAEILMNDSRPNDFQAKLLSNGVGIVKTVVKVPAQIPGKQGLEKEMGKKFLEIHNCLDLVNDINESHNRGLYRSRSL